MSHDQVASVAARTTAAVVHCTWILLTTEERKTTTAPKCATARGSHALRGDTTTTRFHNRLTHSNLNRSYPVSDCCSHETLLHIGLHSCINNSLGFALAAPTESPLWITHCDQSANREQERRVQRTSRTTHPQSPVSMVKYT